MFYYIGEYMKWFQRWRNPTPEPVTENVDELGEIIRKRALEQNSIIDRNNKEEEKDEEKIKTIPFGRS
jgi:hypothetical protein